MGKIGNFYKILVKLILKLLFDFLILNLFFLLFKKLTAHFIIYNNIDFLCKLSNNLLYKTLLNILIID